MKEISILRKILEIPTNRQYYIKEFQTMIWNSVSADNILRELAYDLDFYEPDENRRKEDPNYYGDDQLMKEITDVLKIIDK